jgi:hypothetical protein
MKLPGNGISFLIVPLDPASTAGLAGHLPVKGLRKYMVGKLGNSCNLTIT